MKAETLANPEFIIELVQDWTVNQCPCTSRENCKLLFVNQRIMPLAVDRPLQFALKSKF